jgi:plastocyanin
MDAIPMGCYPSRVVRNRPLFALGLIRADRRGIRIGLVCFTLALSAWMLTAAGANAACPGPIQEKPKSIPHVDYPGVQHLDYCAGPINVNPGQNIIRANGTNLFPQVPGYITRFDPELIYTDGTVPGVDVLHLHHAVWLKNFAPQFAVGEEKSIVQLPQGFGYRSTPADNWILNDMIHDLVGQSAQIYIVWKIDFVPDTSPAAATMKTVHTQWMDVAGLKAYPVFDVVRGMVKGSRYTFPDQASGAELAKIGSAQHWTPTQPSTLIQTVGHLHPGGLETDMKVRRGSKEKTIFRSKAKYYEKAGAVSWDVAMGATSDKWRVELQPGDYVSVHATYDAKKADWYESMGIMPVAVYNGVGVGGRDALKGATQKQVLTHGHLAENNNHGGGESGLPDPLGLPNGPAPIGNIDITHYQYGAGDLNTGDSPPTISPGQTITFHNNDAVPATNTFHSITSCKLPCNKSTGIAYPLANGPKPFDSGQLGFNTAGFGAPAADRDTWTTPVDLSSGTYSYFCRVHPFMRGSFRVQ